MYSHDETTRERSPSRHLRIGPFFKALLISILIESVVMLVTGGAMTNSMMRHSAAAPKLPMEDFLAGFAMIFHLPALLIATPLGLFIFAPLIQVGLMTVLIGLFLRARENGRRLPPSLLS
jgi:hypothetical protein